MSAVDVNVKADPGSCRELASWLGRLSQANQEASAALLDAGSSAADFWEGEAADAFTGQMNKRGNDTWTLRDAVDNTRSALELFADDIETVRKDMDQALRLAREEELLITGTVIHQPPGNPTAGAAKGAGGGMPGLDSKSEMKAESERKHDAFREIGSLVWQARGYERTAHRSLSKSLDGTNELLSAIAADRETWISRGFIFVGTAHGAATTLAQSAESMRTFATEFTSLSTDTSMPVAQREARLQAMFTNADMKEGAANSNARLLGGLGKTRAGEFVLKPVSKTLGGEGGGRRNTVGRAFIGTSVAAAVGFVGEDIAHGKPIGKSLSVNFGGLGAGVAASSATEVGLVAAGASGGPVTAAGLGVGFAATTAWGYFQDNSLRDFYRDLGGDGIDSPYDNSDEHRKARFGW